MSVKYRELEFRSEKEREEGVRMILRNAEMVVPARMVRIKRETYRVSLCSLKGQYYMVYMPREKESLLPRAWLVTIPGFKLCEIPVGREMEPCNGRVTSVAVYDHELVYVCDYHGSGLRGFTGVFERQLKPVPPSLCKRFCPQFTDKGFRNVKVSRMVKVRKEWVRKEWWAEVPVFECRAFMAYGSEEEEIKRRRAYRGMYLLCVEDYWWRSYLRRHEVVR